MTRRSRTLPKDIARRHAEPGRHWVGYATQGTARCGSRPSKASVGSRWPTGSRCPLGWSPDGRLVVSELLQRPRSRRRRSGRSPSRCCCPVGTWPVLVPVWIDDDRFAIAAIEGRVRRRRRRGTGSSSRSRRPTRGVAGRSAGARRVEDAVHVADVDGARLTNTSVTFQRGARRSRHRVPTASSPSRVATKALLCSRAERTASASSTGTVDWLGWTRRGSVLLYAHEGRRVRARAAATAEPKR